MMRAAILVFVLLTGCQSTRIALSEKWEGGRRPSFTDYFDYYWWGLRGDNSVSVQKACVDQRPLGFERVQTVEDIMITAITLGIYTPVTVKIWCGE